jgi:hypothetical protein
MIHQCGVFSNSRKVSLNGDETHIEKKKKLGQKIHVMSLKGGELLIASRFLLARNLPTHYFKGFVGMSKTPKVMCQQISQGDKSLDH